MRVLPAAKSNPMRSKIVRVARSVVILLAIAMVALLAIRIYAQRARAPARPLAYLVPHELSAAELDAADWQRYLTEEARILKASAARSLKSLMRPRAIR